MAGICKSGPSSLSEFRAISWQVAATRTGVGGKSHRSAEQVAEGQGGRGHQKEIKRESLPDQCTEKKPLAVTESSIKHIHGLV